jgi:thiol-disulfide isomerase/thioredoxin
MTSRAVIRPLATALALAGLLVACTGSSGGIGVTTGSDVVPYKPGDRTAAPTFSGVTLRGSRPISSSILSGKVGVVNFWGSWCGPCLREQPELQALANEYVSKPVQFVGINSRRDQRAAALAFADQFKVTYPSVFNPDSSIAYAFRVRFMPATFIIDRQGKIAAEFIGGIASMSELRAYIDSELT